MPRLFALIAALSLLAPSLQAQSTSPANPKRVLVIYATNYPDYNKDGVGDSKELADYYAKVRGVPAANLLGLKMKYPTLIQYPGGWGWQLFHDELVAPVKAKLKSFGATKIDTLLFLIGIPYEVVSTSSKYAVRSVDSLMMVPASLGTRSSWGYNGDVVKNPYFEDSPTVGTDKGRFTHATVQHNKQDYYLVSRLDGVSVEACKDRIDGARYFEMYGSKGNGKIEGNGVVDTRYGALTDTYLKANYPTFSGKTLYTLWDYRMAWAKLIPATVGLPVLWESRSTEIGESGAKWTNGKSAARAPDVLLYGGWYNYCIYHDAIDWLVGSVATDLNSNSLQRIRSKGYLLRCFGTGAMSRGLTAAVGCVDEPFLDGHARPEVLMHYITKGFTFAEAAAISNPAIAWRGIQIGDPVYAPFATRTRKKDTIAPSLDKVTVLSQGTTGAGLQLLMARKTLAPDLCKAEVDWGVSHALSNKAKPKLAGFHGMHDVALNGFSSSEPGYYYRPTLIDPAGNNGVGGTYVLLPRSFTTVDTRVKVAKTAMKRGDDLDARFAVGTKTTVNDLTLFKVELKQGSGAWLDVTSYMFALASEVSAGVKFESVLFRFKVPFYIQGSFQMRVTAGVKGATATHTAAFSVQ